MKVRVALVIPTMDRGGAEKQLCLLARNLDRDHFDPHVILLTRDGPRSESLREAEIPLTVVGKRSRYDPTALVRLYRLLKRLRPQVVHTWLFAANGFGRVAARMAGVKRFCYTASSSCYGIPDQYPTPEIAPARPMYPYALTKYLGEQYAMHWQQTYHLPVVSLRLFNVYGPRSRTSGTYGAVFGVFLAQKLAGKPFTIVGDGEQTRDFTFVTDVADAFVTAAASNVTGEIFNVGSGNTYSVNRLVELIGGPSVNIPKRPGEPDCTFADITKIKTQLGWQPCVSFEQGVKAMLDDIDLWRDAPLWDQDSIADATRSWFKYLGDDKRLAKAG